MGRVDGIGGIRRIVTVRLKSVVPFRTDSCPSWDVDYFTRVGCDKWIGTSVADDIIAGNIGDGTVVLREDVSKRIWM